MGRLCFVLVLAFVSRCCGISIPLAFNESEIVPDLLSDAPVGLLNVQYPNNVRADLGSILTPTQVKAIPRLTWDNVVLYDYYTVVMVDLDAPTREDPSCREWLHWLVVNVPGGDISAGNTTAEYIGAGPGKDSGLHRYVFLVYEQPHKMVFDEPMLNNRSMAHRCKFSTREFVEKYKFHELSAGNFFLAEWDDYVPILYKQLSGVTSSGQRTRRSSTVIVLTSALMLILTIIK